MSSGPGGDLGEDLGNLTSVLNASLVLSSSAPTSASRPEVYAAATAGAALLAIMLVASLGWYMQYKELQELRAKEAPAEEPAEDDLECQPMVPQRAWTSVVTPDNFYAARVKKPPIELEKPGFAKMVGIGGQMFSISRPQKAKGKVPKNEEKREEECPKDIDPTTFFDGRWRSSDGALYVISGDEVEYAEKRLATVLSRTSDGITFKTMQGKTFSATLTGLAADELLWSDGSSWVREFLDGPWRSSDGNLYVVDGDAVEMDGLQLADITGRSSAGCTMKTKQGKVFSAERKAPGKLKWSDGSNWVREESSVHPAPAPRPSSREGATARGGGRTPKARQQSPELTEVETLGGVAPDCGGAAPSEATTQAAPSDATTPAVDEAMQIQLIFNNEDDLGSMEQLLVEQLRCRGIQDDAEPEDIRTLNARGEDVDANPLPDDFPITATFTYTPKCAPEDVTCEPITRPSPAARAAKVARDLGEPALPGMVQSEKLSPAVPCG